jgi:hypothetical protein
MPVESNTMAFRCLLQDEQPRSEPGDIHQSGHHHHLIIALRKMPPCFRQIKARWSLGERGVVNAKAALGKSLEYSVWI